jgi:hypothetical protein
MLKQATIAAFLTIGLGPVMLDAGEPMRMQVSPAVARAPADLVVRVSVAAAADNRSLQVIAECPEFYRSSEVQIDGLDAPSLNVFEFRNLPQGDYTITGVLTGANGRRARAVRIAKVAPPFGR